MTDLVKIDPAEYGLKEEESEFATCKCGGEILITGLCMSRCRDCNRPYMNVISGSKMAELSGD